MPRVKQHQPKKMKWEGGVEILCTDQDEGGAGGDSSDGENSVGSNASAADGDEAPGRKSATPPAKLSVVSPELLMPSPRSDTREMNSGRCGSRSSSEAAEAVISAKRHLDSEEENQPCEDGILDFSKKKRSGSSRAVDAECLNLSKFAAAPVVAPEAALNGPLDLSCSRKRNAQPAEPARAKQQRPSGWSPTAPSPFAFKGKRRGDAADGGADDWNGKSPMSVKKFAETSKSLNELSKLGEEMFRGHRQTAWQSHWVNKGGVDKNKEVFKCVWCKSSFHTLAQLTTHMKETSHCNANAAGPVQPPSKGSSNSDLNLLIKETMPLPRKLVRGQDVWLGKGAEQTRQILKCMWCGQSFRSLAEMTSHMQQTQHYTNIISQEQIISWKSSEDGGGSAGAPPADRAKAQARTQTPPPPAAASQQSHVTAVLTCKVCDQAFTSLKELSAHMVKNAHYKEHIMRSISESGGRRRQNREKRKKSLPVRKLLELERAQHELAAAKNGAAELKKLHASSAKISCEKCGDKIDAAIFVEHIRLCVGNARNLLKSALEAAAAGGADAEDLAKREASPEASAPAGGSSTSPSVLNAIEKLIEKSFDSRGRQQQHALQPNPTLGASILKRLGIDEGADYTKPLVDASSLLRGYPTSQLLRPRERSGSESSSRSRSQTPDRKSQQQVAPLAANVDDASHPKASPRGSSASPRPKSPGSPKDDARSSPARSEDDVKSPRAPASTPGAKNARTTPSPAGSDRSEANESPKSDSAKSLSALSSMFDSLAGKAENGGGSSVGTKSPGSSHPLAALQKLCDYTDRTSAPSSQSSSPAAGGGMSVPNPGAILAFTWACNDAVVGNADSALIKCAFCDTPFISKGAYRHHLSKMHFVKDGNLSAPEAKAHKKTPSPPAASASGSGESPARKTPPAGDAPSAPPPAGGSEESPHSKFLKYTELAKQLSSKYV